MRHKEPKKVWVAVSVIRGFVAEIRAYSEKRPAVRQERAWRRRMNEDYDEAGVARVPVRYPKLRRRN